MSAPAPAMAKVERRIVIVRLADASIAVAYISLIFGLLLVVFPVSFPRLIIKGWQNGNLILEVTALALLIDACLYFRIAFRLSARPTVLAAACLGALPVMVVVGLSFLLHGAIALTLAEGLANLQARVGEEILAHTYFGLVSAVFLPFLAIRLLQQFRAANPGQRDLRKIS
jgi:hypothetical protein